MQRCRVLLLYNAPNDNMFIWYVVFCGCGFIYGYVVLSLMIIMIMMMIDDDVAARVQSGAFMWYNNAARGLWGAGRLLCSASSQKHGSAKQRR